MFLPKNKPVKKVSGVEIRKLSCLENAWLAIESGKIADFGNGKYFCRWCLTSWQKIQDYNL